MEWNSSLYFVDYGKAFDSLDRDTLWKMLRHYWIPKECISLIRNTYEDTACKIIHAGQPIDYFMMKTGVMPSITIPIPACHIYWIIKKTTENRRNCIRGTPWSQLEDRDFADDLALLSQGHQQMQKEAAKHSQHSYNSSSTEARQIIWSK